MHILQYTDDLVIFSANKNIDTAANIVQTTLNNISSFLDGKGLIISPEKSQIVIFNKRKRDPILENDISIREIPIPRVSFAKFLGILYDEKLSGKPHFKYLISKCKNLVDIITMLTGVKWGSHPSLLLNLYKSTIRSVIDYGCQVYNLARNSQLLLKISRLQYRAIRTALGLRMSTPINVLLGEAREPPLQSRVFQLTSKYIYRTLARKDSLPIKYLFQLMYSTKSQSQKVNLISSFPVFKTFILAKPMKESIFSSLILPKSEMHFLDSRTYPR